MKQIWNRWRMQIICILGGVLLYVAMEISVSMNDRAESGYVKRNSYGDGVADYQLLVGGLDEKEIPMELELEERRYTEEEAEKAFERISSQVIPVILNGNSSLNEVRKNLNLVSSLPDTGIRLRWESDLPDVLDAFGTVNYARMGREQIQGQEVRLTMDMTDGVHRGEHVYKVRILPPILTKKEEVMAAFREMVTRMDQESVTEEGFMLPEEYEGKKLYYRDAERTDNSLLLVLGVLLAGLCYAKDISDRKSAVKVRNRQLMLDYSEIVSKLMVFFGAGMTISSAWERIVRDYEKSMENKREKSRHAYEEMCTTYYQMKSGTAEGRAYVDFGRRCGLQPYRKLAGLLEQNRKSGTKNLRNLMQTEMTDAFEQRKNTAKRLGEEASTKLLIPLFITLGIVMVMIVMPAFLSFY